MVNNTGVSDTNDLQTSNINAHYRSYTEANKAIIKSPMALPQECVGVTHNPEVPGRDQRTEFLRDTGFFCLAAVTVGIHLSERLYKHSHIY